MISFGIKDLIDILLVAILMYYIWRLMKGSGAANIFAGILVFIGCWIVIAKIFQLRLLGGILNNLISVGALALVVLFQDEIRQFFSTIGSKRSTRFFRSLFVNRKDQEIHRQDIMPIVMACLSMSKQKEGALIVLERTVGLQDVVQTGEQIDAEISQRLLENLFFKNSPLHDGAVIISKGRIKAAGCILPVSHDADIPKSYGLRHRSALGIAQKSDAIAIVVSEETGQIAVAENGQFSTRLNGEELERLLAKEWED